MGRKSRTVIDTVQNVFSTARRIWRVAISIRLSKEDAKSKELAEGNLHNY
ncbi:hypothetical protein Sgly_1239 [Syntrophobotulus glycolicus DSM 8271]|uniref:Uncharacterized protein n=1 Tax=Syntrophobotulus glycolicus (strain DSM 8271 / FlGlyR) TaxID=645991 RepID=F0SV55_SYNGF|nr:hypothetical protein [Syntrophobotulus glycolicus]ADY55555.1 hypothetical protein Sgly_1239 [Syntrophobotulus glycolicus DSM 8271]